MQFQQPDLTKNQQNADLEQGFEFVSVQAEPEIVDDFFQKKRSSIFSVKHFQEEPKDNSDTNSLASSQRSTKKQKRSAQPSDAEILKLLGITQKQTDPETKSDHEEEIFQVQEIQDQNLDEKILSSLNDLEKMNDLVRQLSEQAIQFMIELPSGSQQFEFRQNDKIFDLAEANDSENQIANNCQCCQENIKSNKDAKVCQFCNLSYCSKCRNKQRAFPMKGGDLSKSVRSSKKKNDEDEDCYGEICKVCDRKFHIKQILFEKNFQIESQTTGILGEKGLKSQIDKHISDLSKIKNDYYLSRKEYQSEYQKIQLQKDKIWRNMRKEKTEQEGLTNENLDYMSKEELLKKELEQLNFEIEADEIQQIQLTEQFEQLESQVLDRHQQVSQLNLLYQQIVIEIVSQPKHEDFVFQPQAEEIKSNPDSIQISPRQFNDLENKLEGQLTFTGLTTGASAVSNQTEVNEYLNGSEKSSLHGSQASSNRLPTEDYVVSENHFKMPDTDRRNQRNSLRESQTTKDMQQKLARKLKRDDKKVKFRKGGDDNGCCHQEKCEIF